MPSNSPSKEIMFDKIRQWQSSGISQKQFCLDNNLAFHSFYYWYKKFRNEQQNPSTDAFIPLQITGSNDSFASISFTNGRTLHLHQAVSADYLNALLF